MTALPTSELYSEAVQNSRTAFADVELQAGKLTVNPLGLPQAFGGGFAITYEIKAGRAKYAIRVFHKKSTGLEDRYRMIAAELNRTTSKYFVKFEYQPTGIKVHGKPFPIVKMEWAGGETLGSYLESHFNNPTAIQQLQSSLRELSRHLRDRKIAHGDIQLGNLMVDGADLRLIDYDGMYVPGMPVGKGTEIGHRHFQHPTRGESHFGPTMDRFSFIAVDISLSAMVQKSSLFKKFATTGENILFCGGDFRDPAQSPLFRELLAIPALSKLVADFECLCRAPLDVVPDLDDFLSGRNIPKVAINPRIQKFNPAGHVTGTRAAYIGALPVMTGTDFGGCVKHIGDRVELIGQIVSVYNGIDRNQNPYVFINFGDWQGGSPFVKVAIWSVGLKKLGEVPSSTWQGRWLSVTGLIDPPYTRLQNAGRPQESIGITVLESSQLHVIAESEAKYRLCVPVGTTTPGNAASSPNQAIASAMRPQKQIPAAGATPVVPHTSGNQKIVSHLRTVKPSTTLQIGTTPLPSWNRPASTMHPPVVVGVQAGAPSTQPLKVDWPGGLGILTILAALVACCPMPLGYYGFLKVLVVVTCVILTIDALWHRIFRVVIPLLLVVGLFLFVSSAPKGVWVLIDIGSVFVLLWTIPALKDGRSGHP